MTKEILIVLYGGRSAEREVSVLSAESVVRAVDYDRYQVNTYFITQKGQFVEGASFDQKPEGRDFLLTNDRLDGGRPVAASDIARNGGTVFPVLHGPMGEDGSVQGFLETLGLPYVGTRVLASSVAMDKISTKRILATVGIPQVPYVAYVDGEDRKQLLSSVKEKLSFPVFVKPSNMGSSVGISKAENEADLEQAVDLALQYDSRILIEQGVDAREIEVAVLGNQTVQTTVPGEVIKDVAFYDYQAKYIDNRITMDIPAKIPDQVAEKMRRFAEQAFRSIGGTGLSRCDFFMTQDGQIFLNELNTMPGFTQWSMYPVLWEHMGLPYGELIDRLVSLAQETFQSREKHLL
ncbi:D-alanine--D-alanine ligase [Streptococcus sp. DD13]|uniref:D-alanine--D-alanine ligase n=1 Tax=Streptococcus sp. DD13 TaxID=1777881 RepID=UPI000791F10B|nr:D-alanine--D-alanine ligase [Streptococcus sp. DD13]KXT79335.1 D-alanine--D-alanine ligase [Streptococcus sp. DD13]